MSKFFETYHPQHLSPQQDFSNSKLQDYKKRYKNSTDAPFLHNSEVHRSLNSPSESYLTPSSIKMSEKNYGNFTGSDSRSSLNALKALQGKVKTLENIIEMKDKEKEIIIKNYQDLTEKIRGDLESIRSVEKELRRNLKQTEDEAMSIRNQLEKELDIMSEKYQQKSQEVQVISLRLEEKSQFIQESLSQLKQENSSIKTTNDKLNILNQALYKEIDEMKEKMKDYDELNRGLNFRYQESQKDIMDVKSSYDQAIAKYRQEFQEYQDSNQEKMGVLEARIEELLDEKRVMENELKESRMNNELLQKEVDSKDIEIMRIKQKDLPMVRESVRWNSLVNSNYDRKAGGYNSGGNAFITMREEIEIDKQELEKNKASMLQQAMNNNEFSDTYIKKYPSPKKENSSTYNKTLQSIRELDKEITHMNQEYQDLLLHSQNSKMTKDKEGVKQKIFNLSEMLRDATTKMYSLKKDEDNFKK